MPPAPLIAAGEGPRLAFIDRADPSRIAEHIVAFANTEGGVIIVGLRADGSPAATPVRGGEIDSMLKRIDELHNPPVVIEDWQAIEPDAPADRTEDLPAGGDNGGIAGAAPLYAIRVPRSTELHALADGRVLIRSGKVNRPLGGQEIQRLASAKNTGDFETEPVPGASIDDFSRAMIDEYL